jgi:coenzyme Q-binding protein COQ10
MPSLTKIKTLPYCCKDIYQLVMDIEKYPQFLPWCKAAKITEVISKNNLRADLLVSFKGIFEKYSSDVVHKELANGFEVNVVAIKGPFKNLINKWKIVESGENQCEVEFFIDFEFNSFLLSKMIGPIFHKASEKMMDAFEARARQVKSGV